MRRLHQGNAAFGMLAHQGMPEQLKFAAAGMVEQDFDELADRPALPGKRAVERGKAGGHGGARGPGKLRGPPQGGMDVFRMPKQDAGAGHAG